MRVDIETRERCEGASQVPDANYRAAGGSDAKKGPGVGDVGLMRCPAHGKQSSLVFGKEKLC
jgi:hypothetical protein